MDSKGADKKRQEKPKEKAKTLNLSQSLSMMINPKLPALCQDENI